MAGIIKRHKQKLVSFLLRFLIYNMQKTCSICGANFDCGNTEKDNCWCYNFPPVFSLNKEGDCLCTDCLTKETIHKINEYINSLSPDEVLHNNKVKNLPQSNKLLEGIDFYIENKNYVFTAWYLLKRGSCCENGCRHCPYGFKK